MVRHTSKVTRLRALEFFIYCSQNNKCPYRSNLKLYADEETYVVIREEPRAAKPLGKRRKPPRTEKG